MQYRFLLPFVGIVVAADDCQRFCRDQLGRAACSSGTWCKNEFNCHAMYWTTRERTATCFFTTGTGDCPDTFPVLCSEASRGRLTGVPATAIPIDGRQRRDGVMTIPLHCLDDCTPWIVPRVSISFSGYGRRTETLSMLFDTASPVSYALLRNASTGPTRVHGYPEGYVDVSPETSHLPSDPELVFGTGNFTHSIPIVRRINETVEIVGSHVDTGVRIVFSYGLDLHLASRIEDYYGSGLIGTAWLSPFAKAAGIFTFIPPPSYDDGRNGGTLVISDRDVIHMRAACGGRDSRVHWFPLKARSRVPYWVVGGSFSVAGGSTHSANWAIDTGAAVSVVPQAAFSAVVAAITAVGGSVTNDPSSGVSPVVTGCGSGNMARFPSLRFTMGEGTHHRAFTIELRPPQYIIPYTEEGSCELLLQTGTIPGSEDVFLLGLSTLVHAVTTFDHENSRVGFCPRY